METCDYEAEVVHPCGRSLVTSTNLEEIPVSNSVMGVLLVLCTVAKCL